ncbi:MAG TPA: glycosyltransferase family 9 protein [Xanthobacteraceae bacterium]|jgi:heptosyltransferase-3|nr:glycosyltransferase family 9 protein [Xanthobacteraceae bacterium]
MNPIALPDAPRVLVVALRRLGDVLLTTPLIRSVKRALPASAIDVLVFAGTEGILAGNPDLDAIHTIPQRLPAGQSLSLIGRLFKRYDLALSAQTGDRPTLYTVMAGKRSAGPVEAGGAAAAIKRLMLNRSYVSDRRAHRVVDLLRLAEAIGIAPQAEIVPPAGGVRPALAPPQPYAVVHAAPMFTYKRWTDDGWRDLAAALRQRGLAAVITGAPGDRAYLDTVWRDSAVARLDGKIAWPDLTALITDAAVYIGPDTAITHLAAATGTPTVALYGPTDPRLWGPWPRGGLDRPWAAAGTIQQRGNVVLVQNPLPCLPCQLEGCDRRLDSHSQCLDELSATQVVTAVDRALAVRQAVNA